MTLFELLGTIAIKNSEANKALDETSQKGESTKSKLTSALSKVGSVAATAGKAVATGLAAGGAAMATLTVKALNLSGELEQNMGGSEAVFKEYAGSMQETARSAFENMGLSTSDYLATANKMGALFQGAGFSIEESMNLSSDAMQRAADVASIMGLDTSAAMEAVAGAAKGNFTMMDNLGVAMNDTTLQAYALEKGINKTTSEMTNQEKIGLAMELFMEKTAYAAGNYAKENDTLAGSLGTAKAALTNFLDGSGSVDQLVNAFSNAADVIIRNVTEIAPRLISGVTEIISKVAQKLPGLLQDLLPVIIQGATDLISGIVGILPELIEILTTSVIPQLLTAFVSVVNALVEALPQLIEAIVSALPGLIPQLVSGLVSMIVTLCTNLPAIIEPLIVQLPQIVQAIVTALVANLPLLLDAGIQLLMGLFEGMLSLIGQIPEILKAIWDGIVGGIKQLFGINSPSTVMAEIGQFIMEGLINGIKNLLEKLKALAETLKNAVVEKFTALKDKAGEIWENLKSAASQKWESIKSAVSEKISNMKDKAVEIFGNIKSKATEIFNQVKSAIETPINKARDIVKEAIEKIKGFFNFEFKWPTLKMPHFGISPSGWKIGDLLEGVIPKLSIEWYAKGGIMKRPTLFDYNPATGEAKVGGEKGAEAIAPIDTLQEYIRAAVSEQNMQVVIILERIVEMLAQFFPDALAAMDQVMVLDDGTLVAKTAPKMNVELGKIAIQKARGKA